MKKFYRISGNADNSLGHLGCSVVLAFAVMMFVNLFIGGMGGIPVFAAFLLQYYLLRAVIRRGTRINHLLAMDSKAEIAWYYRNYAVNFLIVWGIMKAVSTLSRISGWGSISGMALGDYLDRLYGSTMTERWAYLFAGVFMFAFVMSLFPLLFFRRRKAWLGYLFADAAVFFVISFLIALISRPFIVEGKRSWGTCVLDDLLLCELPERWEAACYIAAVLLFTLLVMAVVYRVAVRVYAPKPGVMEWKDTPVWRWKEHKPVILGLSGAGIVLAAGIVWFLLGSSPEPAKYRQVAEFLTEDSVHGPFVYRDQFYVAIDADWDMSETGEALGYLGYKGENCESRFYQLAIANLLYRDEEIGSEYLQMQGADYGNYIRIDRAGGQTEGERVYLLWDEDWFSQTAYGNATGYAVCPGELAVLLREAFPKVEYRAEDFADYDAYFTLRSYDDMKDAIESEDTVGAFEACILVKDNSFYYGSYENPITGTCLQELLALIAGKS